MSVAAGWHSDPYGRFAKRYWDGERWTEHVVTGNGVQQVDPLGTSMSIPFATPETARGRGSAEAGGSASGGGQQSFAATQTTTAQTVSGSPKAPRSGSALGWNLLDRMAPDSRERPKPKLSIALSGLGGVLGAGGIVALILGDDASRTKTVLAGILVTAIAVAIRLFIQSPQEVRSAAVGAGIIGLIALAAGIVGDSFADNEWVPAAVIAALFLAAWALPGFFGRTIMLGIGTFSVVAAVASAIDNNSAVSDSRSINVNVPFFDRVGNQGYVFLVMGAILMGLVYLLDRKGFRGTATGLVASGLLSTAIGLVALVTKFGETGGPVLSVAVGALVCFVGSNGQRRATTWAGAAITTIAVAALVANMVKPNSSNEIGTVGVLSAAVLIGGAIVAAKVRANGAANGSTGDVSVADVSGESGVGR